MPIRAKWGCTSVSQEAERGGESTGQNLYCGLLENEQARQGTQA